MSEYQYYHFVAIDRPLTDQQMDELRAISTRAEITATSFVNEYHWGNLKANPLDFMKRYFDAHEYFANWGSRQFLLRIPRPLIDVDLARQYANDETLTIHLTREHAILEFHSEDEEGESDWETQWLAQLLPLRNDLMQGDLRALYLGWLAGIHVGDDDDDDEPEPPLPAGMKQLNGTLKSLVDFLRVDRDLLQVATAHASQPAPDAPPKEEIDAWVRRLPAAEKDRTLSKLLSSDESPPVLVAELRQQFQRDWNKAHHPALDAGESRRTVGQLREAQETLAAEEREREARRKAQEAAKREKEAAAARKRHLQQLAAKEDAVWREVSRYLEGTYQKDYDRAVELLKDLRDVAAMAGAEEVWRRRVADFRRRYSRKSSLMHRFTAVGFPG